MEIYLVGGAVRDALLGLPVQDRDWVVVGSTPAEMVALGFKPVGRDFPVFLHPVTHEEYALARTERKSAPGYRGFVVHSAPDVTLEQDLARRDVTINSIATYAQYSRLGDRNGIEHLQIQEPALTPPPVPPSTPLVDPFGGQADLRNKLLRHVTDAFCEDPVRILRVARFNARFPDFSVAPETMDLMRQMVRNGEADALVPERVWQELSKGLMAARPSKMMAVLAASGALGQVLPPLRAEADRAFDALDRAASAGASLPVRFTCLMSHFEADGAFLRRVPRPCADLAALWAREQSAIALTTSDTHEIVRLLERCDAFRKPARFHELLACCALLQGVDTQKLTGALAAAVSVTSQAAEAAARQCSSAVVATALTGPQMAGAMHQARVRAVAGFLASNPGLT